MWNEKTVLFILFLNQFILVHQFYQIQIHFFTEKDQIFRSNSIPQ